ncbi:MAG: endonuclease/exonuclease/phosphatase family protein [Deltaproteobacteria bacterium]|nr:endonuclease/exonuclease/phosphatase family protein [Deltaproteobacteria bacterium]
MTFLAPLLASALVALPWRVATYNVAALSARDSEARFMSIAATIKASGFPEVVALQEVADNDGVVNSGNTRADASLAKLQQAITQAAGPTYKTIQFEPVDNSEGGPPGANIRNVLLLHANLHVADVERLFASDAAFNDTRKPLHARVTVQDTAVDIVVVHLSAAPHAEQKRIEQTQRLAAWVRAQRRGEIIVMGDFNAAHDDLVWPTLRSAGLRDAAAHVVATHESGQAFDRIFIGDALDAVAPGQVMPQTAASDHALVWVPLQQREASVNGGCQYAPRPSGFGWWPLVLLVCKRWRRSVLRRCGKTRTCGSIGT